MLAFPHYPAMAGPVNMMTGANTTLPPVGQTSAETSALMFGFICEAFVTPFILGIGIVTNIFSLIILPRANIVTAFKTCLVALTISDLGAGIFGLAQMMVEIGVFGGDIPWGKWHPWAIVSFTLYYIFSLFICTSAAIVIAIVAIRHYTITKPVSVKMNVTSGRAKRICLFIFLGTTVLFLPIPLNILWQSCYLETNKAICVDMMRRMPKLQNYATSYLYFLTIMYGPLLVLIYIASMAGIWNNLKKTAVIMKTLSERRESVEEWKRRQRKTAKITRTLLLILLLDTLCSLPLVVQAFAMIIAPKETVFSTTNVSYKVFDAIAEICLALRPAYNFWLYTFHHTDFRMRAKTLFLAMCFSRYRVKWMDLWNNVRTRSDRSSSVSSNNFRLKSMDRGNDSVCLRKYIGPQKSLSIDSENGDCHVEESRV